MSPKRGPDLPYQMVAAATPAGRRWVVASAKVAAATFAIETPKLYETFAEILDERPSYASIVINAPIGYVRDFETQSRACDVEAKRMLGRRGITIHRAPSYEMLTNVAVAHQHLDAVSATMLPKYREVATEMSPYRQRSIYSGNPELSFYQLNGDTPLQWGKHSEKGEAERREVLTRRLQGIERVIDAHLRGAHHHHLLDAAALLWTARRVFGRSASRVPTEGEWDSEGLRMEFVY